MILLFCYYCFLSSTAAQINFLLAALCWLSDLFSYTLFHWCHSPFKRVLTLYLHLRVCFPVSHGNKAYPFISLTIISPKALDSRYQHLLRDRAGFYLLITLISAHSFFFWFLGIYFLTDSVIFKNIFAVQDLSVLQQDSFSEYLTHNTAPNGTPL